VARIVCKARQLRLDYASKIGRPVEQKEVAEAIEVTATTLSRVERGIPSRIDFETLVKLCSFYRTALERNIGVGDILEFDPSNNKRGLQTEVVETATA
jgi:DNA-binding Xre family transcriptional regulator